MKPLLLAAVLGAFTAVAAHADTLFYYNFDQDPPGVFKPSASPGGSHQQFYLPNNDPNLVIHPADKWLKTSYLSLTANPNFAYDAFGVTTKLFTLQSWKNYIVGWEGVFPLDNGIHESVSFGLSMGHYYSMGSVNASQGYLYIDVGQGKPVKFAAYRRGIPHGFMYVIDNGSKVRKIRATFVQEGELQSSPWLTLKEYYKPPTDANYMTMTIWFPNSQKAGDSSNYFLDKVSINGNFAR
jgi:hypothetical protein